MSALEESNLPVDDQRLREEVSAKYRDVAVDPHADYHFHTGRPLAARLGYDQATVDALPDAAVESFAGVANLFSWGPMPKGGNVVDAGSGAGFDAFVAAGQVGPQGEVVGIDMTDEMLDKSNATAKSMGLNHVSFRKTRAGAHRRSRPCGRRHRSAAGRDDHSGIPLPHGQAAWRQGCRRVLPGR